MNATRDAVDPGAVWRVINGFAGYWIVIAAIRLGVFDTLASVPMTATELASVIGAEACRTAVLADALVATGFLTLEDGRYRLTATADELLVSGRPRSMCDLVLWSPGPHENWPALDRIVKGDRAPAAIDDDPGLFYSSLVNATRPSQLQVARTARPHLGLPAGAVVLELGAGGAPWSTAVLESDPAASATVNDLPGVIGVARNALAAVASRCTFLAGDYLDVVIPDSAFDSVVLGHVLRAEPIGRARRLVQRAAAALKPGGTLVVAEYLGGRDPSVFVQPAMLAVTMMAATREGQLCTKESIHDWLTAAFCRESVRLEPVMNTDLIVATKAPDDLKENHGR